MGIILVSVWMVFQSQLTISLPNGIRLSKLVDAQYFIRIEAFQIVVLTLQTSDGAEQVVEQEQQEQRFYDKPKSKKAVFFAFFHFSNFWLQNGILLGILQSRDVSPW